MILNSPYISGSLTVTGNIISSGSITISGSIASASYASNAERVDGLDSTSFVFTSSYNTDSASVSTRVTRIEGNYATTGSNVFMGAQTVCANITSTGTIIAQTLNVQQVTSSIVYSSGSNIFGCSLSNTQQFTGSVTMTGSLNVAGNTCVVSICSPAHVGGTFSGTTIYGSTAICGGVICGTNATFNGDVLITNSSNAQIGFNTTGALNSVGAYLYFNRSGVNKWTAGMGPLDGSDDYQLVTAGYKALNIKATTGIATFACRVCAPSLTVSNTNAVLTIQGTATPGEAQVDLEGKNSGGTVRSATFKYDNSDIIRLGTSSNITMRFETNDTTRLCIMNTGIAVFACQVCAPAAVLTSNSTTVELNTSSRALKITGKDNFYAIEYIAGTTTGQSYGPYIKAGTNSSDQSFVLQNSAANKDYFTVRGDGNVGIGLADPSTSLSVYNSGGSSGYKTIKFDSNDGSNGTRVLIANRCNTACRGYALVVGGSPDGAGTDKFSIGYFACDSTFVTSNMFVITCTGNVGIGTASPDVTGFGYTTLTIKGGTTAGYAGVLELQTTQTTTNGQNVGIIAFLDGTSRNAQIGVQRDTSTSTSNMMFYTNGGSGIVERMRITSVGNVSVGCNVAARTHSGPGCRYNFTSLNTPIQLEGICAGTGLLVIRDHTTGGSGVWLIDPNLGVICIASNIVATVAIAYSGAWCWCLTSGAVPRCLGYGFYSA